MRIPAPPLLSCVPAGSWMWAFIEQVERMSLELLTLQVVSKGAETIRGVTLSVTGVCQVKVCRSPHQDRQV